MHTEMHVTEMLKCREKQRFFRDSISACEVPEGFEVFSERLSMKERVTSQLQLAASLVVLSRGIVDHCRRPHASHWVAFPSEVAFTAEGSGQVQLAHRGF